MAKKKVDKSKHKLEEKEISKEDNVVKSENPSEKVDNSKAIIKKQNAYVLGAIILMVALILIIFFLPGILNKLVYGFNYAGLDFQKTKNGNVEYFSTLIPLTDNNLKVTGSYALNLRNDPRIISSIKYDFENNTLVFLRGRPTYITINSDGPRCDNDIIAAASLASFLNGFGGLKVEGALDNKTYAEASRMPYVTCDNFPNNTVIMLKPGNSSYINKTSENCYVLTYGNCEMMQVTERFELTIIEYYMSFLPKNN